MKALALYALLAVLPFFGSAQERPASDSIPELVKSTLRQKFPESVDPQWKRMDRFYMAAFILDDQTHYVKIDAAGNWIRTFIPLLPEKLPAKVVHGIRINFPDYRTTGAWRVNDVLHSECFMARLERANEQLDVLFSTNEGHVLDRQASERRLFAK